MIVVSNMIKVTIKYEKEIDDESLVTYFPEWYINDYYDDTSYCVEDFKEAIDSNDIQWLYDYIWKYYSMNSNEVYSSEELDAVCWTLAKNKDIINRLYEGIVNKMNITEDDI